MIAATIIRRSVKEAVATTTSNDIAEIEDYRYQPGMWTMPVYSFGNSLYSARKVGSKKTPKYRYENVYDDYRWSVVETLWGAYEVIKGEAY